MARVRIDIPTGLLTAVQIPVRISDINYGNHLGNDSLISILHEARVQWLAQVGYSELNIEGIGLIMSDLAVEYKNESFYGDQLTIKISVGEMSSVSFELYYQVFNQQQLEIARAKTGMVCYNYESKKIASIPEKFVDVLKGAI
ncbi:MAG: thioesterase [Chitinophagaceae bacterium]|nr:MAG: thioesterase [Chitinophagaceae bacterium]